MRLLQLPVLVPLWAMMSVAQGAPFFLLTNGRPKCVSVIASRSSTLSVQHSLPDLVITSPGQRDNARDTWITIVHKGTTVQEERQKRGKDLGGTVELKEQIKEEEGVTLFNTGFYDGEVQVCFQCLSSRSTSPSRVSITIDQQYSHIFEKKKKDKEEAAKLANLAQNDLSTGQQNAKSHMTRMELSINALNDKVEVILSNANYAKDQEIQFQQQSRDMNKASLYWPMLHLFVLLITGFTQANHIVRYFKQKHIF